MKGYFGIGLDQIKDPINVGSVLRVAHAFGASFVAVSGSRFKHGKNYKRVCTDTGASYKHLPLYRVDDLHDIIPFDCIPVAVEIVTGARNLFEYKHPERAFYIFGAEDQTLGSRVLNYCRDIVQIETKICLNVAMAANIVCYDRKLKQYSSFGD